MTSFNQSVEYSRIVYEFSDFGGGDDPDFEPEEEAESDSGIKKEVCGLQNHYLVIKLTNEMDQYADRKISKYLN